MKNQNPMSARKKVSIFALLTAFLFSTPGFTQDFKILGYFPYYHFNLAEQVDFDKLTHLYIAFANPDMEGNISVGDKDIRPIVDAAHAHNVQVLLSLAGGTLTPEWAAAWEILLQIQNRSGFISKLMDYLREYELEGIDVDLEWSHVNEKYSGFVLELRDSLDAEEKLMTAALPGNYRYPEVSDQAMHAFDFINMMAYDLTGPWNPSNPGQHSPYSFAVNAIQYWKSQGVSGEKLTLGVPFYGWDFTNPSNVVGFTYRSMVEQDPAYSQLDQVGQAYYNGIPTIEAKTRLALDQVSGVMIWELGQDAFNEYSLLTAIHQIVVGTVDLDPVLAYRDLQVFPNPFTDYIEIHNRSDGNFQLTLSHISGQVVEQTQSLDAFNLPTGFYVLSFTDRERVFSRKLVKR
jgi:chitinase